MRRCGVAWRVVAGAAVVALERRLSEAQGRSSPLERVWSLMTEVPWEQGKGLVLDTPEDCE